MTQHKLTILQADSPYVKQGFKCPVSKAPLQPGDPVVVCREGNREEIISSLEGFSYLEGACPLCGEPIDIPLSSLPKSSLKHKEKKPSYSSVGRRLRIARLSTPVVIVIFLVTCMLSVLALFAFGGVDPEEFAHQLESPEYSTATPFTDRADPTEAPTYDVATSAPTEPVNRSPTPVSIPTITSVNASRPSRQSVFSFSSVWSLASFRDLKSPGTERYYIDLRSSDTRRWTFAWCATDRNRLAEILSPLTVDLVINDSPLSGDYILEHEGENRDGWQCHYWSTVLTDWRQGATIKLEIRYRLNSQIFDGAETYPPGLYHQLMFVDVE